MKKINRRKFIKKGILASAGLLLLDMFWFEKYIIDWNTFDLTKGEEQKIRLVQISDLHLNTLRSFHRSIARKLNEMKPDLILFTGDAIDKKEKVTVLDDFLKLIDPAIQKFAVTGNWEYWGQVDLSLLKQTYKKYNCELLINENRTIILKQRKVTIIGLDDFVGGQADFRKSIEQLSPSDTTIVLSHCPEYRESIQEEKGGLDIALILSGHTHGGQISFLGWAHSHRQVVGLI